MKTLLWGTGLLLAVSLPAQANELCRKIASDVDRLACYDKAFPVAADAESEDILPVGVRKVGEWFVKESKSKIDDSIEVFVFIRADGEKQSRRSSALYIRCVENQTAVLISWSDYLGSDPVSVTTRIDSKPAETKRWGTSTGGNMFGLWSGASAIAFVKQLIDAKTLAVRTAGYRESPKTESFTLEGMGEAIKPVRTACKW